MVKSSRKSKFEIILIMMYGNVYTSSPVSSGITRTSTNTNLTWSNPSSSMYVGATGHIPLPYTSFEAGPGTSTGYRQNPMFQFAPYPSVPMPFDYSQVYYYL